MSRCIRSIDLMAFRGTVNDRALLKSLVGSTMVDSPHLIDLSRK
jgi:hypothetical protein